MKLHQMLMIILIAVLSLMALIKFVRQDNASLSRLQSLNDFDFIYLAGNAWLDGSQPYTRDSIHREALKVYGTAQSESYKDLDVVYPPTTFAAVIPLLFLPHQIVSVSVFWITILSYVWVLWILANHLKGLTRYSFLVFGVNYAPFHSGLLPENITVIMAALILLPLLYAMNNEAASPFWFIFLGEGVAIKPQLGVLFLVLLLIMKEWTRFVVAFSTVATLLLLAVGQLWLHGVHWLTPLLENLRSGPYKSGHMGESTLSFVYNGSANFRLINLSPVVYFLSGSLRLSILLPFVFTGVLLIGLVGVLLRRCSYRSRSADAGILILSAVGAISLLPFYSRFYSAILILPIFSWLWSRWHRGPLLSMFFFTGTIIFSVPWPQLPIVSQVVIEYLQHPGMSIWQASRGLTMERFAEIRPEPWQQVICALPNIYLLLICLFVILEIWRQSALGVKSVALGTHNRSLRD